MRRRRRRMMQLGTVIMKDATVPVLEEEAVLVSEEA